MSVDDGTEDSKSERKKKAAEAKAREEAKLAREFNELVPLFQIRFNGDVGAAEKATYPLFSRSCVEQLLGKKKPLPKEPLTLRRFVWFMRGGPEKAAYHYLLDQMGLSSADLIGGISEVLSTEFDYRYFRFRDDGPGPNDFIYNWGKGRIRFSDRDGIPAFEHWGSSYRGQDAEHRGLVFRTQHYVFMLSMGDATMRMAISDVSSPEMSKFGVVATPRDLSSGSIRIPLAARFIMVPETNKEQIVRLSDKTECEAGIPRNGVQAGPSMSTKGVEEFHELSDGRYCYAMLSNHR